jgi:maltooligosyltrehalose trehalohydrolase
VNRYRRRLPVGAELQPGSGTHFRIWSPDHAARSVCVERVNGSSVEISLEAEPHGYAAVFVPDVSAGDRYRFRLDGKPLADPASRFQPEGPFGPSEVVDPDAFEWTDQHWTGHSLPRQVLYEMHVGTFTAEGTWQAAMERLPDLARLGITVLEIMPVADFPGRFGWGYDGVFPYAPTRLYGLPDDFRRLVDRAHQLGLGVILDVVYNHLGPDGCVFRDYAAAYFTKKYENEWGDALNFDDAGAHAVREYFVSNAGYWIDEYHLDGLRLDATQTIHDESRDHLVAEVVRRVRQVAGTRRTIVVAEHEPQHVRLVECPERGGYGVDALWNDDFHHSANVALTGHAEAYYSDHRGAPQEFISAAKYGYLFQGQHYSWQKKPRGTRTRGVSPAAFVTFLENHDQVANSGDGSRLRQRSAPGQYRAMTALLMLMPATPMLFQGQEFGSTRPFQYFADQKPELAAKVEKGRAEFVAQFPSLASPEMRRSLPSPNDPRTFERCKLDWHERELHAPIYRLHADLLRLRRDEKAFTLEMPGAVDGAVLGAEAFVLRFLTEHEADERLLIVNLGPDLNAPSFPEPLVAPPAGHDWEIQWSSESPDYGGSGTPPIASAAEWHLAGHAAFVLKPVERTDHGGRSANRT